MQTLPVIFLNIPPTVQPSKGSEIFVEISQGLESEAQPPAGCLASNPSPEHRESQPSDIAPFTLFLKGDETK